MVSAGQGHRVGENALHCLDVERRELALPGRDLPNLVKGDARAGRRVECLPNALGETLKYGDALRPEKASVASQIRGALNLRSKAGNLLRRLTSCQAPRVLS